MYIIKSIYISNDLQMTNVAVFDPEVTLDEELMLKLDELIKMPEHRGRHDDVLRFKCRKAAQENRALLLPIMYQYPFHIKRIARKFLLIQKIRRSMQHLLKGQESNRSS